MTNHLQAINHRTYRYDSSPARLLNEFLLRTRMQRRSMDNRLQMICCIRCTVLEFIGALDLELSYAHFVNNSKHTLMLTFHCHFSSPFVYVKSFSPLAGLTNNQFVISLELDERAPALSVKTWYVNWESSIRRPARVTWHAALVVNGDNMRFEIRLKNVFYYIFNCVWLV